MSASSFLYGLIIFLTSGLCFADNGLDEGSPPDTRMFIRGSTVTVYLNYDQFISAQMLANHPTLTQKNVESAIQMVIDRWVQVSSLNLKINYGGITTNTSPGEGEVVIGAATVDPSGRGLWASASRFYTNDVTNGNCYIGFFRTDGVNELDWYVFNFKDYPADGMFLHSILMHEFGHCLGLQHNQNTNGNDSGEIATLRTVMMSGPTLHASYGPYIEDVEDIVALYGTRGKVQLDVVQSTDDGLSWSSINPNIPKLGITQTPVLNRDNDRMMMFFTDRDHHPAYIMANASGQGWDSMPTPVTNVRSLYGTTGSGFGNEYMWAWVDPDQSDYVTILYTSDAGAHWEERSGGFRAASAPSIRKIDSNTWVISYLYLDENTFKNENGRILTRVSTDDGLTWSGPYELASGMRAVGGVTVTSQDRNHIRVGFVRTSNGDDRWTTTVTTIAAHLTSSNAIVRDNWVSNGGQTSTSEASFTTTSKVFVQGRETSDKRLTSCNSAFSTTGWQQCAFVNAFSYRGVPPAVGGRTSSNFVYMIKEK